MMALLLKQSFEVEKPGFNHKTDVYLAVGKEGLAPSLTPHVSEVDVNLLADKLKASKSHSLTVYFDYLPQEDHATISHQAISNAFKVIFQRNQKKD